MEDYYAPVGYVNILFGIFCAVWAQDTDRRAWLWFFTGLFFGPITGIVLASKNAAQRRWERLQAATTG